MLYVPDSARDNLWWGLSRGRWAFSQGRRLPGEALRSDIAALRVGDLILLGTGGKPRGGGQLEGWEGRSLEEAHLVRVASLPYENSRPFWPDELRHGTLRWNPTIDIEVIRSFGRLPLRGGETLSPRATDAWYHASAGNRMVHVKGDDVPLFDRLPPAFLRPRLIGPRRRRAESVTLAQPRVVALERLRGTTDVRERPRTTAKAIESRLVHDYAELLIKRGEEVGRLLIPVPDEGTIYSDLYSHSFDDQRGLLVEAKAHTTRTAIRTAIGQLLDYGRHCKGAARAVLLPREPPADLRDLLHSVRIDAIWQQEGDFADSADGRFC